MGGEERWRGHGGGQKAGEKDRRPRALKRSFLRESRPWIVLGRRRERGACTSPVPSLPLPTPSHNSRSLPSSSPPHCPPPPLLSSLGPTHAHSLPPPRLPSLAPNPTRCSSWDVHPSLWRPGEPPPPPAASTRARRPHPCPLIHHPATVSRDLTAFHLPAPSMSALLTHVPPFGIGCCRI